jgi:hypothetical protein
MTRTEKKKYLAVVRAIKREIYGRKDRKMKSQGTTERCSKVVAANVNENAASARNAGHQTQVSKPVTRKSAANVTKKSVTAKKVK